MSKNGAPPPYGFVPPPSAPPSYAQAVGGVPPSSPYVPQNAAITQIVTTVVPIGPHPTHMICPSCHAEIDTSVRREPGLIAYVSGFVLALMGYVFRWHALTWHMIINIDCTNLMIFQFISSCWIGCCLIPCCVDECTWKRLKDAMHRLEYCILFFWLKLPFPSLYINCRHGCSSHLSQLSSISWTSPPIKSANRITSLEHNTF